VISKVDQFDENRQLGDVTAAVSKDIIDVDAMGFLLAQIQRVRLYQCFDMLDLLLFNIPFFQIFTDF